MKCKTSYNWTKYKQLRNLKTKIKRHSIRTYFHERCSEGPKGKDFWHTIKPFLSKKTQTKGNDEIILKENEDLISEQNEICNILNNFYVNIADNIGISDKTPSDETHPSIQKIREHTSSNASFDFQPVNHSSIKKYLTKLNPKKATGVDTIPPKLLRYAADTIAQPIADIANGMLDCHEFPAKLKLAQVTPVFKKDDPFIKKNYRPVSILPSISKIFERIINDQLSQYFENIFNQFLSAFRPKFGCQTTLIKLIEDWKSSLDRGEHVAAVLMDLSKAFDCLPHDLTLSKLKAYGLSENSCKLVKSYLTDRRQRVRVGQSHSSWQNTTKGVPQGSILGPLIFNIFMNDIFFFTTKTTLYNYADDNTLSYSHKNTDTLKHVLEQESDTLIKWFNVNQMQANPDKFQAIAVGRGAHDRLESLTINNTTIHCEESVKLLGIDIDFMLNFNKHISNLCKKAATQLDILLRLSKFLKPENKLLIYKSFIKSNFNYCPLVWHFCSKTDTDKLEKLQHRALKIAYSDFNTDYETLLHKANMPTLHQSRIRTIALEAFKCLHKLNPAYLHDMIKIQT